MKNGTEIEIKNMSIDHVINCLKLKKLDSTGTEVELRKRLGRYVFELNELKNNIPCWSYEFWKD